MKESDEDHTLPDAVSVSLEAFADCGQSLHTGL